MKAAMTYEVENIVVAMSPKKNSNILAPIPVYAVNLLKTLLRSITTENSNPPIKRLLRPIVPVAKKSGIPRNGRIIAISDKILLEGLSARQRKSEIVQNNAIITRSPIQYSVDAAI